MNLPKIKRRKKSTKELNLGTCKAKFIALWVPSAGALKQNWTRTTQRAMILGYRAELGLPRKPSGTHWVAKSPLGRQPNRTGAAAPVSGQPPDFTIQSKTKTARKRKHKIIKQKYKFAA